MNKFVVDTMALILRLERRKVPTLVKEKFIQAEVGNAEIFIPTMVFAEIAYLAEKSRIETNLTEVQQYIEIHSSVKEYPFSLQTVKAAFTIDDIPELHDRIIAAVAKELQIPIITNDPAITLSPHVETLWK